MIQMTLAYLKLKIIGKCQTMILSRIIALTCLIIFKIINKYAKQGMQWVF